MLGEAGKRREAGAGRGKGMKKKAKRKGERLEKKERGWILEVEICMFCHLCLLP